MQHAIVHYGEIALKGKNRPVFADRLAANLRTAVRDLAPARVWHLPGRMLLTLDGEPPWAEVADRLRRVIGVANFAPALRLPLDMAMITEAAGRLAAGRQFASFRITARRAHKGFPLNSQEIERAVGAHIVSLTGARVNLTEPAFTIFIEILPEAAFVSADRQSGPSGLPVGSSGRVVCLMSGGIDSPVAAYRMMRRGCRVAFAHFHGTPFVSRDSIDKALELVALLTRFQNRSRLYLVPFGEVQREVVLAVRPPLRVVIYRRLMGRIAEVLARRLGAGGLVTGESLGQVASQTLENLASIEDAVSIPILRPLIGTDKEEISRIARQIGTYDISILPDQDCCTLFVPKNPATRTTVGEVRAAEAALTVEGLVQMALEKTEVREFRFPEPPTRPPANPA